jgi:hypothetical protein
VPEFDSDGEVLNTAALRATMERGCLNKERYDRWLVRVGDMLRRSAEAAVCEEARTETGGLTGDALQRFATFSSLMPCFAACVHQTPTILPQYSRDPPRSSRDPPASYHAAR